MFYTVLAFYQGPCLFWLIVNPSDHHRIGCWLAPSLCRIISIKWDWKEGDGDYREEICAAAEDIASVGSIVQLRTEALTCEKYKHIHILFRFFSKLGIFHSALCCDLTPRDASFLQTSVSVYHCWASAPPHFKLPLCYPCLALVAICRGKSHELPCCLRAQWVLFGVVWNSGSGLTANST